MSWIDRMRKASPEKKERIIWICAGVAVILLVIIWIITAHYHKSVQKDTQIFQTLNQGVKDLKDNYNKPINQ